MTSLIDPLSSLLHRSRFITLAALSICASLSPAMAQQTPLSVGEAEAQSHLQARVDPIYPPIAKAAHVVGQVVLQIDIDAQGRVAAVKVLSAPPMLIGAATDAVREWIYAPFTVNGMPCEVQTVVKMEFTPGMKTSASQEAQQFGKQLQKCNEQLRDNGKPAEVIAICQGAAEQADKLSGPYYGGRRTAYIYYATALLRNHQAKEATMAGEKAIAFMQEYHDESSIGYAVTGQAKAVSGDLAGANRDLEIAELRERKALDAASPEHRSMYTSTLASLLKLHAQVLTALGKPDDAQKKLEEANKL